MSVSTDQELIRALGELGAPAGATTGLLAHGETDELAALIQSGLEVRRVRLLSLSSLAGSAPLKLIISRGVLDRTRLRDLPRVLATLKAGLDEGGVLAIEIRTGAAPIGSEARSLDHVLFPHLAAQGQLGGDAATLTPLTASGWLSLLNTAGFDIVGAEGFGSRPPPYAVTSLHAERLALFDPTELASGVVRVVARRREDVT